MKKIKNPRENKSNSAFTLVELILSSSISMLILFVGYYLSNIVAQSNKNDKSQIQLFSKIDSASDFIIDEIKSGKRIFIDKNKIDSNCSLPNGEFLFGISLPTQATESAAYSLNSRIGKSWKDIDCPVIYYLNRTKTNSINNSSFQLMRYGPGIDEKGFYNSSSFTESLISGGISEKPLEEIKCSNNWTRVSKRGISLCVDSYRRTAEINITGKIKKSGGKDLFISKTSGANNRIQDDILMGKSNTLNLNNKYNICNNANACHLFGTKIRGNVTFLIDNSKSMGYRRRRIQGKIPLEAVKDQLIKSIANLRNIKFQVIAFGEKDYQLWEDGLKPATSKNRLIAIKWVRELRASQNDTRPSSSIRKAIQDLGTEGELGTEQIIILSDGIIDQREPIPDCDSRSIDVCMTEYNKEIRNNTQIGTARIDTISLAISNSNIGYHQTCNHWIKSINWMGRLASANGGKCSVIK